MVCPVGCNRSLSVVCNWTKEPCFQLKTTANEQFALTPCVFSRALLLQGATHLSLCDVHPSSCHGRTPAPFHCDCWAAWAILSNFNFLIFFHLKFFEWAVGEARRDTRPPSILVCFIRSVFRLQQRNSRPRLIWVCLFHWIPWDWLVQVFHALQRQKTLWTVVWIVQGCDKDIRISLSPLQCEICNLVWTKEGSSFLQQQRQAYVKSLKKEIGLDLGCDSEKLFGNRGENKWFFCLSDADGITWPNKLPSLHCSAIPSKFSQIQLQWTGRRLLQWQAARKLSRNWVFSFFTEADGCGALVGFTPHPCQELFSKFYIFQGSWELIPTPRTVLKLLHFSGPSGKSARKGENLSDLTTLRGTQRVHLRLPSECKNTYLLNQ